MTVAGPRRVVSDLPLSRAQQDRIIAAFGGCDLRILGGSADLPRALDQADIAFLSPQVKVETLIARPHLAWVHIDISGMERFSHPKILNGSTVITGSAGRSAPVLAEHVLMFMLAHVYRLHRLMTAQNNCEWATEGFAHRRGLFGQSVGIIGLGQTGREIARMAKALNMQVLGFNRSALEVAHVDTLFCDAKGDGLAPLLEQSDFVVLCLALTDETQDLIGAPELERMKPGACLINIGRGALIQEEALIEALENGQLAGAGLDVFRQEPLPPDSPLWHARNILITPHVTPGMPDKTARTVDIILDNIARFRRGQPLRNAVRPTNRLTQATM
ncbi:MULTISPECIES: D-2-hydroxyacid dehydrogenase [Marinovum]|uniref:D-2-hydroxyacid dehydrogenase n=1 Tax=Marinovum TaxID=367771 RepID=UPI00237AC060|nr:D-2-hydroxyacid dehydrogenase [Marinovum sp. PR37]MDD9746799.1 D-2-hydroxyacid dehydrogenase [Marinovum sp. PR37]